MKIMSRPLPALIVATAAFLLAPTSMTRASDSLVAFGLTNKSIFGASLQLDSHSDPLYINGLTDLGYRGVSVKLGEADSGLTFAPYKQGALNDDQFMIAHAYGRVGGTHRRVSTVSCRRDSYSAFPLSVDLLPLGSLLQTIEVYSGATLLARQRHTLGTITIDTSNTGFMNPRVNPFWRWPDGGVGVLLESGGYYLQVILPNGRQVSGNRIYFRAEYPLFPVDYLTRVDIFGGGPAMNEFIALDERIGMFGRMHRGLGNVAFTAKGGRLKIANLDTPGDNGVQIEAADAPSFDARLLPVPLKTNGASLELSAVGSGYSWNYYYDPFLGPALLRREEGETRLHINFPTGSVERAQVRVFDAGILQGFAEESLSNSPVALLGTNLATVISLGARGGVSNLNASLVFKFAETHPVTFGGQTFAGDEIHVSPQGLLNSHLDIGTFFAVQFLGGQLPPVTIIGEDSAPTYPYQITIEKRGSEVAVSWPVTSPSTYIQYKPGFDHSWIRDFPATRIHRSRYELVRTATDESEFFSLHDWFATGIVE